MKQNDLKVSRETQLDSALINEIRDIYFEGFPPSERIDFRVLVADIANERRWLFTAKMAYNLVGFAVTIPLRETDAHLLEYMAVVREARNQGIGSTLLEIVSNTLQFAENVAGLILEVESDDSGTEYEKQLRKRRIQFYRRNGAHLVECAPLYRIPNLAGEDAVPMKLMWLPLDDTTGTLSGRELRDCIRGIYSQSFGRSMDDSLLQSVLKDLAC